MCTMQEIPHTIKRGLLSLCIIKISRDLPTYIKLISIYGRFENNILCDSTRILGSTWLMNAIKQHMIFLTIPGNTCITIWGFLYVHIRSRTVNWIIFEWPPGIRKNHNGFNCHLSQTICFLFIESLRFHYKI